MEDLGTWVKVARVEDIPRGTPLFVEHDGHALALYRAGKVVYATDDTCSHAEASLCEGTYRGFTVTCPRHGGQFDIRSGRAVKMPAISRIAVFPVRVIDQSVWLPKNLD